MSQFEFLSLNFEFEGNDYFCLIRKKKKGAGIVEYLITVMNGKLERLLYGNHIITEINGQLQIDNVVQNQKQAALKLTITKALHKYLVNHRAQEAADRLPAQEAADRLPAQKAVDRLPAPVSSE